MAIRKSYKKPVKTKPSASKPSALKTARKKKAPALDSIDDPELRQWVTEVRRKREENADPKRRRFVVSRYDVDGEKRSVARPKSEPTPIGKLIKTSQRKTAPRLSEDIKLIREAWERAVGPALASESKVYSFLKGVLTVEVHSGSLLQEIRQFHRHAIFSDLTDLWQASQPLLKIQYRLGSAQK